MTEPFDPSSIPAEEYDAQIARLAAQRDAEFAAFNETEAKLKWWQQGRALYALEATRISPLQEVTQDLAPSPPVGRGVNGSVPTSKPVLKEAIFRVMREDETQIWKVPEVMKALEERGWMPNGANAGHIVRSRLSTLTKAKELERVGYGRYTLPKANAPDDP
jgi:hypothetical protein